MNNRISILCTLVIFFTFSCKEVKKDYYTNGKTKVEVEIKNNVKNGKAKWYYPNGNLKMETEYLEDKEHGIFRVYYETGELKTEGCFNNGKKEGELKGYYKDGNVNILQYFKNGKENGLFKDYYETGELEKEVYFKNGKQDGMLKVYYKKGTLKTTQMYKNGFPMGKNLFYYENNQLKMESYVEKNTTFYYIEYDSLGNWLDEYRYVDVNHEDIVLKNKKFAINFEVKGPNIDLKDSVLCSVSIIKLIDNNIKVIDNQSGIIQKNNFTLSFISKEKGELICTGLIITNKFSNKRKEHQMQEVKIMCID